MPQGPHSVLLSTRAGCCQRAEADCLRVDGELWEETVCNWEELGVYILYYLHFTYILYFKNRTIIDSEHNSTSSPAFVKKELIITVA